MKLRSFFIIISLFSFASALADDPGITKVRLIQLSDSSYRIEADAAQQLIWAIKQPIFPDRFDVSEIDYETKTGWVVVRSTATSRTTGLSAEDELLLPWLRNGADLTVRWLDGSITKGLFIRSLDGIHIPMSRLIEEEKSTLVIARDHFLLGLRHSFDHGIHFIFILSLILLMPKVSALKVLLWLSLGHGLSMILFDLNSPGFDLLFVDMLGLALTFLMTSYILSSKVIRQIIPMFILYGVLHSLGLYKEIESHELSIYETRIAQFTSVLAIEICQYVFAFTLIISIKKYNRRWLRYIPGSLAICLLLVLLFDYVKVGNLHMLDSESAIITTKYELPASQASFQSGNVQQGARSLSSPIMNYVTIEPYEVRLEILIRARTAVQILGVDDLGMGSIPIQSLEPVKQGLLDAISKYNEIKIDRQKVEPTFTQTDFVTLSAAGVLLREAPQVESLDNGVIGLTVGFETEGLADDVALTWNVFPEEDLDIETTIVDPFGGAVEVLSRANNSLSWKKQLSGYMVPAIEQVSFQKQRLPIISICFFIVALLFLLTQKTRRNREVQVSLIIVGFLLYPTVRSKTDLPIINERLPSSSQTAQVLESLLTNVYRSFDVRNENDVYDRLATSVEGDQLTAIYLQNRQSMELEYRGGARAKVDELEIEEVRKLTKNDKGDFEAEISWLVGGSVSHFGHTHYRRNYNQAIVTFGIVEDHWKIKKIEMIDERRVI